MSTVAFSAPTPRSHATDVDGRTVAEGDPATASLDTVEAAHRHGVRVLRAAGVEEPWLDALLLLMEVTRLDKASLLAYPQRRLAAGVADRYVDLLERRARREPTAYILGRCEFYGLEFAVDRRVLIPRPETEMLVDLALEALRPYRPDVARRRVVEVGTGSGAIAVSLLRTVPDLRLTATDCAAEALAVARSNAARLGVADRLELRHGDLLEPVEGSFDLLLANLPYVPKGRLPALQPEVRDYEPRVALDGGPDGAEIIRRLLAQAARRLNPGGHLAIEVDSSHARAVADEARRHFPDADVVVRRDPSGWERVVHIHRPRRPTGPS